MTVELKTLKNLIREPRSIRRYLLEPIPQDLIETLIESAG